MLQRYSFDEETAQPSKIESSVHVNRDLFLNISSERHHQETSAIPGPSGNIEDEDGDVSIIIEKTIEKKTFLYKPVTNQCRKSVCDQLQRENTILEATI
ncbi:hypothetical protein Ddc_16379 [Ditylenchus destructor]|nr:hypothetical protein Ddc_16379 [Ditylenchus destructor]